MAINQWDKGSKENGPNAYKKGNRTKGRRYPSETVEVQRQRAKDIAKYKEAAERMRKARKYKQEDIYTIYQRIKAYIAERTVEGGKYYGKPLTVSGLILASGMGKDTYYTMLKGGYDYQLVEYCSTYNIDMDSVDTYIDGIPAVKDSDGVDIMLIFWSEILQKAMLAIEAQTEERLYLKGRVGDIFGLKAVHGWREEESPQTVNQTLVIATEEQARKAIEMLK